MQTNGHKTGFEPAVREVTFYNDELPLEEEPHPDLIELPIISYAQQTREIQAPELISFLPDFEVMDRYSTEALERKVSDAASRIRLPEARRIFLDNLRDFKERGLPQSEYTGTLESVLRILQADDGAVDAGSRKLAALGAMANAAHPESIAQGRHGTCSVAALEHKVFVQSPARAAAMIEQAVLLGKYQSSDGMTIEIPEESMAPGLRERKNFPPMPDGERNYASQLFQVTALNEVGQHFKPPMRYLQYPNPQYVDGEDDLEADFWLLANGSRRPFEAPGRGVFSQTGGLTSYALAALTYRLTGETNGVILNRQYDTDDAPATGHNLRDVRSSEEFEKAIAELKRQNKLPAIISVYGDGVKHLDKSDSPGGKTPNHFVTVDDYRPALGGKPAQVLVHNNWKERHNGWMQARKCFEALT